MDRFSELFKEFQDDFMQPDIILGRHIIDDYGGFYDEETGERMDPVGQSDPAN